MDITDYIAGYHRPIRILVAILLLHLPTSHLVSVLAVPIRLLVSQLLFWLLSHLWGALHIHLPVFESLQPFLLI